MGEIIDLIQISVKRCTDSKIEAIHKLLVPKSKQSSITIYQICVRTNDELFLATKKVKYYHTAAVLIFPSVGYIRCGAITGPHLKHE